MFLHPKAAETSLPIYNDQLLRINCAYGILANPASFSHIARLSEILNQKSTLIQEGSVNVCLTFSL